MVHEDGRRILRTVLFLRVEREAPTSEMALANATRGLAILRVILPAIGRRGTHSVVNMDTIVNIGDPSGGNGRVAPHSTIDGSSRERLQLAPIGLDPERDGPPVL
jgi:hypothetical protein